MNQKKGRYKNQEKRRLRRMKAFERANMERPEPEPESESESESEPLYQPELDVLMAELKAELYHETAVHFENEKQTLRVYVIREALDLQVMISEDESFQIFIPVSRSPWRADHLDDLKSYVEKFFEDYCSLPD